MNLQRFRFIALPLLVLLVAASSFAGQTVKITTGEFVPYCGRALPHDGYINHVIREAFKIEGVKVQFDYYPWQRAYILARDGHYAATSFWYLTKERPSFFYISKKPIEPNTYYFFHLKAQKIPRWSTLPELRGLTIGLTRGYSFLPEYLKKIEAEGLSVQVVDTDLQNFKKLLAGHIDIFPLDSLVGKSLLCSHFTVEQRELITYHPQPFFITDAYLLFSKSHPDGRKWCDIFNQGMSKLESSGTLALMKSDLVKGQYDVSCQP